MFSTSSEHKVNISCFMWDLLGRLKSQVLVYFFYKHTKVLIHFKNTGGVASRFYRVLPHTWPFEFWNYQAGETVQAPPEFGGGSYEAQQHKETYLGPQAAVGRSGCVTAQRIAVCEALKDTVPLCFIGRAQNSQIRVPATDYVTVALPAENAIHLVQNTPVNPVVGELGPIDPAAGLVAVFRGFAPIVFSCLPRSS